MTKTLPGQPCCRVLSTPTFYLQSPFIFALLKAEFGPVQLEDEVFFLPGAVALGARHPSKCLARGQQLPA